MARTKQTAKKTPSSQHSRIQLATKRASSTRSSFVTPVKTFEKKFKKKGKSTKSYLVEQFSNLQK